MTDDSAQSAGLDERFRRALDSILDLVVIERAVRDDSGEIVDFVIEWMNNSPVDVAGRRRDDDDRPADLGAVPRALGR